MSAEKGGGLAVGRSPSDDSHIAHSDDLRQVRKGIFGEAALLLISKTPCAILRLGGGLLWP